MSISNRQNQARSLDLLAAQRHLYSRAKRFRNAAICIVVGVATLGLLASVVNDQPFTRLLPTIALLSWLIDQWLLTTWERDLRAEAAAIQEMFDCSVLVLPWPTYKATESTDDRVRRLAMYANAKRRKKTGPLSDWYPPNAIPADPMLARLHCQRANVWWDVNLREHWIFFIKTVFHVLLVLLVLLSAATGLTVAKVLAILASNIRAMAWVLNERDKQESAIERLHRVHSFISRFGPELPPSHADIRSIQDVVFDHRSSAPPIPDRFYQWYRRRQEREAGGVLDS